MRGRRRARRQRRRAHWERRRLGHRQRRHRRRRELWRRNRRDGHLRERDRGHGHARHRHRRHGLIGTDTVGTDTDGTDTDGTDTEGTEIDGIVTAPPWRGATPPTTSASRNPASAATQANATHAPGARFVPSDDRSAPPSHGERYVPIPGETESSLYAKLIRRVGSDADADRAVRHRHAAAAAPGRDSRADRRCRGAGQVHPRP